MRAREDVEQVARFRFDLFAEAHGGGQLPPDACTEEGAKAADPHVHGVVTQVETRRELG